MSSNISSNTLTKEQLFACLEYDGVEVSADTISKAKNNNGEALRDIDYEYECKLKDYPKAMAWYQLGADQNYSLAYNNIGALYHMGLGVSRDYVTAIEYYLKAARGKLNLAMSNIALLFLNEFGVPLDKYKALEWYIKSGYKPEQVKELNEAGIHLREEDKGKTIYQLINETDDILREERKKKQSTNEQEMESLRIQLEELQNKSKQEKEILNQQLTDKEKLVDSLQVTIATLQSLVQAKTSEIEYLKENNQRPNNSKQKR